MSRLMPGRFLVHADLHNHTILSDGDGEPERAYASMRDAGLDVAAITDHAYLTTRRLGTLRKSGLEKAGWLLLEKLCEQSSEPNRFVALRGFEWSHPTLGHINVWGSQSLNWPQSESNQAMVQLWEWLAEADGATDGLVSFNHPGGRGAGRFDSFLFDGQLRQRLVGLEIYNKADDYLFEGVTNGHKSPLIECLDRGWRPALLGVSDEHGEDWGQPEGKGRTGMWVTELTEAGVREALESRLCFATREKGVRVAANICGAPMGSSITSDLGHLEIELDMVFPTSDNGSRALDIQALGPGTQVPTLLENLSVTLQPGGTSTRFVVPWPKGEPGWLILRISDPALSGLGELAGSSLPQGRSIAYTSPVWINQGP